MTQRGSKSQRGAPALAARAGGPAGSKKRLALSGADGNIGRVLRRALPELGYPLRSADIAPRSRLFAGEDLVHGDLNDPAAVDRLLADRDVLIHMAATSVERPLEEIVANNLYALVQVYEGARRHGVKRVVFPSSNHVVGMYPVSEKLETDCEPRPDTFYGLSKVWGESLARMYWDKHGIESVCLRIGTAIERPQTFRHLSTWLGLEDLVHLIECCVEAPELGHLIVWGVSANTRSYWSNAHAARLGYAPSQNAERWAEEILARENPVPPEARGLQGGRFVLHDLMGPAPR